MQKILAFLLTGITVQSASAEKLTCDQLSGMMSQLPAIDIRPYCDTAEIRCRAVETLMKRPAKDMLRQILEPKLRAQVEYELEVCEAAVRDLQADYLKPRTPQDQ